MENDRPVRVFLADDHAMVREGLAALIDPDPEMLIVGQCGDGLEVVERVLEAEPDVVVLDIAMPGLNGLDICQQLRRKCRHVKVLILSMHGNEQFIIRALQNGASGYLLKEAAAERLIEALRVVAEGGIYLGPGVPRSVLERVGCADGDLYENLTCRERQVFHLIAEGKSSRAISEKLKLAVNTVHTHRGNLMRKLDIHDQTALVKYAIRKGIVSP